ncbi:tetratricopeptide repeat protein [Actinoplanes utahensis]|uniref:Uncharacterized protein n=1 Tax=Actinoplanes utahensis TaxID=1869 RepID=A0A0A6UDH9_ACTUT|nr:tetratricopeptide repeat protein [Actinoplanes utahensis]KHD72319.1 hypothetical protein MB27_38130 [Actinoplanes utahensis]
MLDETIDRSRRRELAALHDALTGQPGTCVLTGPPGVGRTALAAAYAETFPGAARWVSLAGSSADPDEMAATFAAGLRARTGNPPVADAVAEFAERVAAGPEPTLLVVDDIPGELTAELIDRLSLPEAGGQLRTVLITGRDTPGLPVPTVELGPIGTALGGHPMALRLAGGDLTAMAARLDAETVSPVVVLVRDRLDRLGDAACRLLRVAALSSPAALPAGLIRLFLGASAEQAVAELTRELLATSDGGACQVHPLVRDIARQHLPPVDWTALARQFADAVLDHPWSVPLESFLVARHATRLAGRPDLPDAVVDRLHRRVIAHHQPAGEAALVLPHHRELAERHFDDPEVLIAAARVMRARGEPEEAKDHADRAVPLATDPATRHAARLLLVECLEEIGDTTRADALWTLLGAADGPDAAAFLRARRLRGHLDEARTGLTGLIDRLGTGSAVFHQAQEAQLELARTELDLGAQSEARRRAARVIAEYTARHLTDHATAVAAIDLIGDARFTVAPAEPDDDLAGELLRLRDRYAGAHGRRHRLTLALAVAHAEAERREKTLLAVRDDVRDRFPLEHSARSRTELLLGFAAARGRRNEDARDHFTDALHGFRAVLGDTHPNTLRAELALGVALKLTGGRGAARHMLHVLRHAPASVGIGTDLFLQSAFGSGLSVFPSWLWRRLTPQARE